MIFKNKNFSFIRAFIASITISIFILSVFAPAISFLNIKVVNAENLSLVSYWSLDEATGATRIDAQGDNDLTDTGSVPAVEGVEAGSAIQITNGKYLSIPDNESLSTGGNKSFTISMWVRLDSKTGTQVFASKFDNISTGEYALYFENVFDRFVFSTYTGGSNYFVKADTLGSPAIGQWYYIQASHDAEAGVNSITIDELETDSISGVLQHTDTDAPFVIGAFGSSFTFPANATIDEVSFSTGTPGSLDDFFAGGDGSSEDPYQIETCTQLQSIDQALSAYYILNNHIECAETADWNNLYGFDPIANGVEESFSGSLDGNGYEIRDLYINRSEEDYVGLFAHIELSGVVSDLAIVNADIEGLDNVGILAGSSYGTIEDSHTTGSVFGDDNIGGLVGSHMSFDTITNSYSEATVVGDSSIGGLVGRNQGNIYNSHATGDVSGNSDVGGLVGESLAGYSNELETFVQTEISESYATGDVFARDFDFENLDYYQLDEEGYVSYGGLVGTVNGTLIEDSHATGDVIGYEDIGGLAGTLGLFSLEGTDTFSSTIRDSYATGNVHGFDSVGGLVGDVFAGQIYGSYATGNVFGETVSLYQDEEFYEQEFPEAVGGLVGEMDSLTEELYDEETETYSLVKVIEAIISESYAYGNVEGNYRVGGFVGINTSGKIENSYARGSVTAINENPESIGGFAGTFLADEGAEMIHVYATGVVSSETETLEQLGGLVGYADVDDDLTTSFWDTEISGLMVSGGGTGKTASQMKTLLTFTDAGWDFEDVWDLNSNLNDGYPILVNHIGDQEGIEGYVAPESEDQPQPRRRSGSIGRSSQPTLTLPTQALPTTIEGLQTLLAQLQAQLAQLLANTPASNNNPFVRDLQLNDQGDDVRTLQQLLISKGYNIPAGATGLFGPQTRQALIQFQQDNNITPAAGFFGPITRARITQ